MRIMISTRQGAGHFGPLVPFAKAFLRNNDEILVTAPANAAMMIAEAGFDHHVMPDPPQDGRRAKFARARQLSDDAANAFIAGEVFIRTDARAAFPHMLAAIEAAKPDVVVYEASEFAAALAAEASGIPSVCVGITQAALMHGLRGPVAEALDELRADFGLEPDPDLERLAAVPYMTLIPEALEDDPSPETLRFRVEDDEPRALPDWWKNRSWPLVYLTLGTVAPMQDWFPALYRDAIDALSLLPVRVLVTVGRDRDARDIGPVGPNIKVRRWIPQSDVLPHADVLVCHGGSGTVTGGLTAGVPMAVLPLFADQPHNARRVADIGAGIALDGTIGLADAVRKLFVEPSYGETAQRIAADLRALPTVDKAAKIVHGIAQTPAAY